MLVSSTERILVELPTSHRKSGLLIGSDVTILDGYASVSRTAQPEGSNGKVVVILGQWMTAQNSLPDIEGDDMVGVQDLLQALDVYGPCELWEI